MSAFINQLERQKKRELSRVIDLPARGKNLQWLTLKGLEDQAIELHDQVVDLLPNHVSLRRTGVQMETFSEARPSTKIRIMAQISETNHRTYMVKVHCHEMNPKGNWRKLAKAEFHYAEKRKPA